MNPARKIRRHGVRPTPGTFGLEALDRIFADAPDCPGYGGGKWAVYAIGCCWWTSNPERDGGRGPGYMSSGRFGEPPRMMPGLPACPSCGSMLMQAPLGEFMAAGVSNPGHYGPGGLATFAAAHAAPCRRRWSEYPVEEVSE